LKNDGSKKNNLIHIGDILGQTLNTYRPKPDMEMTGIWKHWTKAVGTEVAKNAKPALFKDGILIANVSSSVWIQHLKFMEKDIISNINQLLKKELVKKIRFKIAKLHN
jgi:predicted nucleic acid-binding Zn ribbon protein